MDFLIAVGCLVLAAGLGISVAVANLKDTERIQRNLDARREYKREKNRKLARFYGIPYDK